jgi:two-component system cell cycle sensor histidine kinase/response regulator CckA
LTLKTSVRPYLVWGPAAFFTNIYLHSQTMAPPGDSARSFWRAGGFQFLVFGIILLAVILLFMIAMANVRKKLKGLQEVNAALSREVAESKKAAEEIHRSEEAYRTLIENINVGIYRTDPQEEGKFIEVNRALAHMFGYKRKEDLLQLNISDLYQDPDDRDRLAQKMWEKGFVQNEVVPLKKKNGTIIWCSVTAVAVYDRNRRIKYRDGMIQDITGHRLVEEALKESEEKYRSLVESASEGILIMQKGNVKFVNPRLSEIAGYSVEEVTGETLSEYIHPDELSRAVERYRRRMKRGRGPRIYETVLRRKDGSEVVVEMNADTISYQGESADLVFIRDITERKQFERRMHQIQKMEAIGQLAGGVAHDFNNILTVIKGHAELAMRRTRKENSLNIHLKEILQGGERACDLVRHLLAFSRLQIIEPRIIDVNQVITNLEQMLIRLIGEDIKIRTLLAQDLPPIKADPGQIEQIFMNLIINARDAIYENAEETFEKKITIETGALYLDENYVSFHPGSHVGLHVLIAVSDTGRGMTREVANRVFEPFFTTKKKDKGTGLGLSTVYGIVKQNNGCIYVYSEPDKGTTFKIYWPYAKGKPLTRVVDKVKDEVLTGAETILIVEDDVKVKDFARDALKSFGYQILEAENGSEALKLLEETKPEIDLLIADMVMPEMGGKEVAERVKEMVPTVKVLFTSGYTDSHIVHKGDLEPGINFIQKPYSIHDLAQKVRTVLDTD